MSLSAVQHASTKVARAVRARDPIAETEARRALTEAKMADYIERALESAPPLTDSQRARLAELLRPVRVSG